MKYRIASIAMDESGMFWLSYLGDRVEQGGLCFGWDSAGSDLETILALAKSQITKHQDQYMSEISKLEEQG